MKCIKCSNDLGEGVKFCKFCGQNQTEEVVDDDKATNTPSIDLNKIKEQAAAAIDVNKIKEQASAVASKISDINVDEIKNNVTDIKTNTEEKLKSGDKQTMIICGAVGASILILVCLIFSSMFGNSSKGILYATEDFEFKYLSDYKAKTEPTELFDVDDSDGYDHIITDNNIMYTFITESKSSNYSTTIYSYDLSSSKIEEVEIDDFSSRSSYIRLYKATGDNFYYLVDSELYYYNAKTKKTVEVIDDVHSVIVNSSNIPAYLLDNSSNSEEHDFYKIDADKAEEITDDVVNVYYTDFSEDSSSDIYIRKYGEMYRYEVGKGNLSLAYEIEYDFEIGSREYENYMNDYEWKPNTQYSHRVYIISPEFYYVSYNIDVTLDNFIDDRSYSYAYDVVYEALDNLNDDDYTVSCTFFDIYHNGELIEEKATNIMRSNSSNLILFNQFSGYNKFNLTDIISEDGNYSRYSYRSILSDIYYYVRYENIINSGTDTMYVIGEGIEKTSFESQLKDMSIKDGYDIYIDDIYLEDDGNIYISVNDDEDYEYYIYKIAVSKGVVQEPVQIFDDDNSVYLNYTISNPYNSDVYFMIRENGMNVLYKLEKDSLVEIEDGVYSVYLYKNGDVYVTTDYDSSSNTFRLYKIVSGNAESIVKNISSFKLLNDDSILYLEEISYSSSRARGADLTRYYKNEATVIMDEVISYLSLDENTDFVTN